MSWWQTYVSPWSRTQGGEPEPSAVTRAGVDADLDESLWQILAGDDTLCWRDITGDVGSLVYSHVRPGGPASCSFSAPADLIGLGYNELQTDEQIVVRYAGQLAWSGYVLPRGRSYGGE